MVELMSVLVPALGLSAHGTGGEVVSLIAALFLAVGIYQVPNLLKVQEEETLDLARSEERHQQKAHKLETSLQHLEHALNHLPGLLLATDSTGIIKTIHGQGRGVLGPAANWAVGRSVSEVYGYAPWLREGLEKALLGQTTVVVGRYGGAEYQVGMAPMGEGTSWRGGIVLIAAPAIPASQGEQEREREPAPPPEPSREARRLNRQFMALAAQELAAPVAALNQAVRVLGDDATGRVTPVAVHDLEMKLRALALRLDDLFGVAPPPEEPPPTQPAPRQTSGVVDLSVILHQLARRLAPEAQRQRAPLHLDASLSVIGPWSGEEMEALLHRLLSIALATGAGRPVELELTLRDEVARLVMGLYSSSEEGEQQFGAELEQITRDLAGIGGTAYLRGGLPMGLNLTIYLPVAPTAAQVPLPDGPEGVA